MLNPSIRTTYSRHFELRISRPAFLLTLALLLAFALRILFIDSRGLWGDEAFRVIAARQATIFDTLRAAWAQPPSAPLYWVALHVWVSLFGHGDVAVRLFSVPASAATLFVVYQVGRMAGGTPVALLSALLLAIAPFAIETGQEATMYSWSALFATGTLWSGITILKSGGRRTETVAYVVFATLLLYTHYMGALLIVEIVVAGLIWRTTDDRRPMTGDRHWIKVHLLIALLYSPWAIAMGLRLAERAEEFSHLQHRAGLVELFGSLGNMSMGASAAAEWPTWQLSIALLSGGFLMLLAILLPRPREQRQVIRFLAAIPTGFILITVGTSAVTGAWLVQPRFFTLVLPAALVVVAACLPFSQLRSRIKPPALLALFLLATWVLFQLDGVRAFYTRPVHGRDGVREAAAWLNTDRKPDDIVAANQGLLVWFLTQYHDGPMLGLPENADVREGYRLWPTPDLLDLAPSQWDALMHKAAGAKRIWLVYLPVMDQHGTLLQLMQQQYHLVEQRHYGFADIYLFGKG